MAIKFLSHMQEKKCSVYLKNIKYGICSSRSKGINVNAFRTQAQNRQAGTKQSGMQNEVTKLPKCWQIQTHTHRFVWPRTTP